MKNYLFLLAISYSVFGFSQCNIEGNSIVNVNEEATFTILKDIAQCENCHQWSTIGGDVEVIGNKTGNSVKILKKSTGRPTVMLTVMTSKGIEQCSKTFDVVDPNSQNSTVSSLLPPEKNCDVNVNSFKEIKYDQGLVNFIPNELAGENKYDWEVFYSDNTKEKSSEIVPQFSYSSTKSITKVVLRVTSKKCIRDLSKSYDPHFWTYFR